MILGNLFDTLFWDGKYKFTIDLYWAKHKTRHKNFDQNVANSFNFYLTCMKNADSNRLKNKRHVANNRSVHKHSDSPIFLARSCLCLYQFQWIFWSSLPDLVKFSHWMATFCIKFLPILLLPLTNSLQWPTRWKCAIYDFNKYAYSLKQSNSAWKLYL